MSDDGVLSVASGEDDESESGDEEKEHESQEQVGALVGALELLPDEHAPDGGDHRCSLAEGVGDGGSGFPGGDVAAGRAETPDGASEDAHHVGGEGAFEVLAVAYGLTDEGTAHGDGVEDEVAQQHADG